jgi:hypothetical protein
MAMAMKIDQKSEAMLGDGLLTGLLNKAMVLMPGFFSIRIAFDRVQESAIGINLDAMQTAKNKVSMLTRFCQDDFP